MALSEHKEGLIPTLSSFDNEFIKYLNLRKAFENFAIETK